ncbi:MAG TPA: AAA family ATPase, partial [Sporichthyaceae bacterium]|nr:AAA family ATPase [Sporichthyaceae bacterium]
MSADPRVRTGGPSPVRTAATGAGIPGGIRRPTQIALVGRDQELGWLQAQFHSTTAVGLGVVLVSGAAGVGKSRLVRELAARVPADTIVLTARGYPLGATDAYGLWIEALDPLLAGLGEVDVRALCGEYLDDAAALLPRAAFFAGPRPAGAPRARLAEALTRVIDNLSLRAPVLVVLDDLHLGDPSSWELLRRIARQLPARPVLIVGTARPEQLSHNDVAAHVLFELDQDGRLLRFPLGSLDPDGVTALTTELLGRTPPTELVRWLTERSEGNPLFLRGLVRALVDEGADLSAPALRRLPEDLVERIRSRMGRFAEAPQRLLEIAAVTGRPVTAAELEGMVDRSVDELAGQLDDLVAAGALVEEETGRHLAYAYSHPLIRDAVYSDIGSARRRVLHRVVARVLSERGRLAESAEHFACAADVGDPEALDVLLRAIAEAEGREAYREAMALIGALVELLPDGDERWRAVYEAVSWEADWVVDHRADSHGAVGVRAMRAIEDLFDRTGEPAHRRGAVKFRLATFLAWGVGDLAPAAAAASEATQLFAAAGDRRSELLATREEAFIAGLRGDLVAMAERAEAVRTAAHAEGHRFVEMQACQGVGYACGFLGRLSEAETATERQIAIATEDGKTYRATVGLGVLALVKTWGGDTAAAQLLLDRAVALNPNHRDTVHLESQIVTCWWSGNMSAALEAAHEIVAWAPAGTSLRRSHGMAVAAVTAVEADRLAEADRFLGRAQQALRDRDWSAFGPVAEAAAGMLAWRTSGPAAGLPRLVASTDRLMAMRAHVWALGLVVLGIEAAAEERRIAELIHLGDQLDEIAAAMGGDGPAGTRALARGWVALLDGSRAEALESARAAVAALDRTGWNGHLARALHLLGRAADRAEAVPALERAAELCAVGGASWRRGKVLADLQRLGGVGRRAADAALGPAALSPREREIARLAATGLSAR